MNLPREVEVQILTQELTTADTRTYNCWHMNLPKGGSTNTDTGIYKCWYMNLPRGGSTNTDTGTYKHRHNNLEMQTQELTERWKTCQWAHSVVIRPTSSHCTLGNVFAFYRVFLPHHPVPVAAQRENKGRKLSTCQMSHAHTSCPVSKTLTRTSGTSSEK